MTPERQAEIRKAWQDDLRTGRVWQDHWLMPEDILSAVSRVSGVTVERMIGKNRTEEYTRPRHVAMYLIDTFCGVGPAQIARMFNRDHTTTIHGIQRINRELAKRNEVIRDMVQRSMSLATGAVHE